MIAGDVERVPTAAGCLSRPTNPVAKSRECVIVHRLDPSPWTTTGLPALIRAMSVHCPSVGIEVAS